MEAMMTAGVATTTTTTPMLWTCLSAAAATAAALALTSWAYVAYKQRQTGAPGPHAAAVISHYTTLAQSIQPHVTRNEPFVHLWFGFRQAFFACNPDATRFVLRNPTTFAKNERFGSLDMLTAFAGQQLVNANGNEWRRQRRVIGRGFHCARLHAAKMDAIIQRCLQRLAERQQQQSVDVDVVPCISDMALDVLGKTIFDSDFEYTGKRHGADWSARIYDAYTTIMGAASSPLWHFAPALEYVPGVPGLDRVRRAIAHLTRHIDATVDTLRRAGRNNNNNNNISSSNNSSSSNSEQRPCLLSSMVASEQLTADELRGNWFIMFVAGHETTAAALSWLVFELADQPELQELLYAEMRAAVCAVDAPNGDTNDDANVVVAALTRRCDLLTRVLRENLRHHPPLLLLPTRVCVKRSVYGSVTIPRSALVGINIHGLHHHPAHWHQPDKFDPDRFLPERVAARDSFAYVPFSSGARRCVGAEFSLCEQRLFVYRLLRRYRIVHGGDAYPHFHHPVMGAPDSVRVRLVPRQ